MSGDQSGNTGYRGGALECFLASSPCVYRVGIFLSGRSLGGVLGHVLIAGFCECGKVGADVIKSICCPSIQCVWAHIMASIPKRTEQEQAVEHACAMIGAGVDKDLVDVR